MFTFLNTAANRRFAQLAGAFTGFERSRTEVIFSPTHNGIVGVIYGFVISDQTDEWTPIGGYRQILDAEWTGDSKAIRCEPQDLSEALSKDQVLSGPEVEVSEEIALPRGQVIGFERSLFLDAFNVCEGLPPLDATKNADVNVEVAGMLATILRSVDEVMTVNRLPLNEESRTTLKASIPMELLELIVEDVKKDDRTLCRFVIQENGKLWIEGSAGMFFVEEAPQGTPPSPSPCEFVTRITLHRRSLDALDKQIQALAKTSAGGHIEWVYRRHSVELRAKQRGFAEGQVSTIRPRSVVGERGMHATYRSESLRSLVRAARIAKEDYSTFYVTNVGDLVFQSANGCTGAEAQSLFSTEITDKSPLILWASGGSPELLLRSGHKHILLSFANIPKWVKTKTGGLEEFLSREELLDDDMKVFLDSGAYSVWNAGKQVNLDEYIAFLLENEYLLDVYVALDEIRGSVKANIDNYRLMTGAGLSPLYVWHLHEDWNLLDSLLRDFREEIMQGGIGAGGAPHTEYRIRAPYISELIHRVETSVSTRIHLFGTTAEWFLKRYSSIYSADSTSWHFDGMNRRINTPFGKFSVRPGARDSIWGHDLQPAVERFISALPFPRERITLEGIAQDRDTRHVYNLGYLAFFEDHYSCMDWMRLEHRFIPFDELKARGPLNLDGSQILLPRSWDQRRTAA